MFYNSKLDPNFVSISLTKPDLFLNQYRIYVKLKISKPNAKTFSSAENQIKKKN